MIYDYVTKGTVYSIANILLHAVCLHGLFPATIDTIVVQGWSIGVEVIFYILAPLLIKFIKNSIDRCLKLLCITVPVVWALDVVLYKLLPNISDLFWYLWFPNQLPAFLIGIALFLIIKGERVNRWASTAKYCIGITLWLFLSLSDVLTKSVIIAGVILILWRYGSKIIDNVVFRYIGKVSFGVYLFHYIILNLMITHIGTNFSPVLLIIIYAVIFPAVSIAVGSITHYFIEKPLLRLERRIEKRIMLKN